MNSATALERIEAALKAACEIAGRFTCGDIDAMRKAGGDPVTEADLAIDAALREILVRPGEGWLSEEMVDDLTRLDKEFVWIVDPLDGTKEFVTGIDEWCISIGLAQSGRMIAGGICNPLRREIFLGTLESGVTLNGRPAGISTRTDIAGAKILASRSEVGRGQWKQFESAPFAFTPMGSVAYKLARVAAGLDDATFTLVPKNEWDIAAGTALVHAAGGRVVDKSGREITFNREKTLLEGLFAAPPALIESLMTVAAS